MKLLKLLLILMIPGIMKSQIGVGPGPYCMPFYTSPPCNQPFASNTPGNFVNDFINSYNTSGATFNINNNNSGCNAQNLNGTKNYRLWGCQYYMICSPGQVISSTFQSGIIYGQGCTVFVDWNNNGIYDIPTERMTSTPGVAPAGFTTPMPAWVVPNVPNGVYRMRVRCAYSTMGPTINPCNNYTYGECEEYFVYVNTTPSSMTVNLTSNSPVCIGGIVNINTSVTLGPGSGTCTANTYTYNWTGPMSYTSNVMSPSFTATNVLQSGVYTLNITPPNGCGCGSTNTIQIWVNPNPSTSITNSGPVCKGSTLIFTNIISGSGNMTYNWTGPNGFMSQSPQISFAQAQTTNTGVYNFTVVSSFANGGQCQSQSSSSVIVVPVTQVSVVPSYTQCQGTNINLVSTPGANSYTWTGPNLWTSNISNPILNNVTPTQSGNYSVTAYWTSNQTTLVCSSSAVSNVSIVPMTQVVVSQPTNICQGSNVILTASAQVNPTYNWVGPNNLNLQQQSLVFNNVQPLVTGNYSVTAIWSIGQVSCQTSTQTGINVVPTSSITVVPQINVCDGGYAQLTSTAQGAQSYTWTGPNGFNVNQALTQFQNLTSQFSGQYTVTALFTNGNLNCYSTNTTNLLVNPKINFSLTPVGKLCFGQNLNINGPGGATSYTWSGPGFNSNTQNLFISQTNTINIGTYNLTVDLNGCKTFGSVYIDIQDPIYWKSNMPNKNLCKGQTFTLQPNVGGGSGNYAYTWNPSINYLTGSYQTGVAMGTTYYNVSVYDISCPTWTINQSVLVTVNSVKQPSLSLQSDKCEPFCQIFNSGLSNNSEFVSYLINNQSYGGDSINICLPAGDYTISTTVLGNNGCREVFNYSDRIIINKKPDAYFNWSPDFVNTISDNKVNFNHLYPKDVINWFWQIGEDTTQIKSPFYTFEKQGNYPVSLLVTNKWGCKDTLTKVIKVQDEFLFWTPDVFTPNGDGINDVFKPKCIGIKSYDIFVYDRWGSQIYNGNEQSKGWDGLYKGIMCQDGVYIYYVIVIDNNNIRYTKNGHITLLK
jgi:gliding motility-associated-like protein